MSLSTFLFRTPPSGGKGRWARAVRWGIRFVVPVVLAFGLGALLVELFQHAHSVQWAVRLAVLGLLYALMYFAWEWLLRKRRQGVRPLHSAIRYFPVLDLLSAWTSRFTPHPQILEVGSGSLGLGDLIGYRFTGCDLRFEGVTSSNMKPVTGSATELPFAENAFDLCVSVDTLEHIPTEAARVKALLEMLRVASSAVIVGYPCGEGAYRADEELAKYYQRKVIPVPAWLQEHLDNRLPDSDFLAKNVPPRFAHRSLASEPLGFHLWLMKRDPDALWTFIFSVIYLTMRSLLRGGLRLLSKWSATPYRRFYVLAKDPSFLI